MACFVAGKVYNPGQKATHIVVSEPKIALRRSVWLELCMNRPIQGVAKAGQGAADES
jgi:hypothetical protein